MFGYIYITTNAINGRRYIGKRTSDTLVDNYIGSGTLLKRAIKKHGFHNFSKEIIYIAETLDELNDAEKILIHNFDAVNDDNFYNLADGGQGGNTWGAKTLEERLQIIEKVKNNTSVEAHEARREKCRRANQGKTLSDETKSKISVANKGNTWDEARKNEYAKKRKIEVANGIRIPPKGNAGNKEFRHSEETKRKQSAIQIELHRKAKEKRGSWVSPEGQANRQEKLKLYYTPERKAEHRAKILAGRERAKQRRDNIDSNNKFL